MPVHNTDIAGALRTIADLIEIDGGNRFRIRAYREAARTIDGLSRSVAEMVERDEDLSRLAGIGADLAGQIRAYVETGSLPRLEELRKKLPAGLSDLMEIRGLGAKRVRTLYRELGVTNVGELERAARKKGVRDLDGFGEKTERAILEEIDRLSRDRGRIALFEAGRIARPLIEHLRRLDGVKQLEIAGSFRRGRETVGDLDILVATKRGFDAAERLVAYEDVDDVLERGSSKCSVRLSSGLQVDLRSIPAVSFGAALLYFTGSKSHNIALRTIAKRKHRKVNEYGLFDGDERIAARSEKEIYERLGLQFIEPELRENRGEIEAARDGDLPALVRRRDIRGDLHTHTDRTDGRHTLAEMADAAKKRGLEYIAVTDHSQQVRVAGGLGPDETLARVEEIERAREEIDGIGILTGMEVDILEDGSLDLPDDVLALLDVVVCSVHSHFGLSREKQTDRIVRAMDNPYCMILGHPTGRLIGKRDPYDVDMERVVTAAKERGCLLELNAHPSRLDIDDINCKLAKETGVGVAISTDAHHTDDFDFLDQGVRQARRGWLEPDDVANTRPLRLLRKLLRTP